MNWSIILHKVTIIVGFIGFLALIAAWIAGENGRFFGQTQQHLFYDSFALFMLAILLAIGTIIHQNEEKNGREG